MIVGFEGCCGQLGKNRARRPEPLKLPDNPNPEGGVPIIYVGAGYAEIKGALSGLTYILADHQRHFRAHPADVKELIGSRDFILPP
jgi:hypothetical protein